MRSLLVFTALAVSTAADYDFCGVTGISDDAKFLLTSYAGRFTITTTNCQGTGCKRISNSYLSGGMSTEGGQLAVDIDSGASPSFTRGYFSAGVLAYVEVECVYDVKLNKETNELNVWTGIPGVDNFPAWQSIYCFDLSTKDANNIQYIKNYANAAYWQFGSDVVPSFKNSASYLSYGLGFGWTLPWASASDAFVANAYAYTYKSKFASSSGHNDTYFIPLTEIGNVSYIGTPSKPIFQCRTGIVNNVTDPLTIGTIVIASRSDTDPPSLSYVQPTFLAQQNLGNDHIEEYCVYSATSTASSTGSNGTINMFVGVADTLQLPSSGLSAGMLANFGIDCPTCVGGFQVPACFSYVSTTATGLYSATLPDNFACGSTAGDVTMAYSDPVAAGQVIVSTADYTYSSTNMSTVSTTIEGTVTQTGRRLALAQASLAGQCPVWAIRASTASALNITADRIVVNFVSFSSTTLYFLQNSSQNQNKAAPAGCLMSRMLADVGTVEARDLATATISFSTTILAPTPAQAAGLKATAASAPVIAAVQAALAIATGVTISGSTLSGQTTGARVLLAPVLVIATSSSSFSVTPAGSASSSGTLTPSVTAAVTPSSTPSQTSPSAITLSALPVSAFNGMMLTSAAVANIRVSLQAALTSLAKESVTITITKVTETATGAIIFPNARRLSIGAITVTYTARGSTAALATIAAAPATAVNAAITTAVATIYSGVTATTPVVNSPAAPAAATTNDTGAIIGGVIGGFVFLVLLGGAVWFWTKGSTQLLATKGAAAPAPELSLNVPVTAVAVAV
jgi:hypothetical protein